MGTHSLVSPHRRDRGSQAWLVPLPSAWCGCSHAQRCGGAITMLRARARVRQRLSPGAGMGVTTLLPCPGPGDVPSGVPAVVPGLGASLLWVQPRLLQPIRSHPRAQEAASDRSIFQKWASPRIRGHRGRTSAPAGNPLGCLASQVELGPLFPGLSSGSTTFAALWPPGPLMLCHRHQTSPRVTPRWVLGERAG